MGREPAIRYCGAVRSSRFLSGRFGRRTTCATSGGYVRVRDEQQRLRMWRRERSPATGLPTRRQEE